MRRCSAVYEKGRTMRVMQTGPAGIDTKDVKVGSSRRLRITVPLSDGATPETVSVRIRPQRQDLALGFVK